jgi:NADH-quinone oxidoreductase subunit G
VAPPGEARPGWKVLRVLGNLLELEGFEYRTSAEIRDELAAFTEGVTPTNNPRGDLKVEPTAAEAEGLFRIGDVPIYAVDMLVRRAPALQRTPSARASGAFMNPEEAGALGIADGDSVTLKQNGASATARVHLEAAIPKGCVRLPAGVPGSETLGALIGTVMVEKD